MAVFGRKEQRLHGHVEPSPAEPGLVPESQRLTLPNALPAGRLGLHPARLARINRESIDAIRQAIRELEQAGYVAGWSSGRELAELKASLEVIRSAAHELISALDEHLAELRQQREADLSAVQEAAFALDNGSTCSSRPVILAMTTPCMARTTRLWMAGSWTRPV